MRFLRALATVVAVALATSLGATATGRTPGSAHAATVRLTATSVSDPATTATCALDTADTNRVPVQR